MIIILELSNGRNRSVAVMLGCTDQIQYTVNTNFMFKLKPNLFLLLGR